MGMYDYVRCDYPLPDGRSHEGPFQTKDFTCQMAEYRILASGELVIEKEAWHGDQPDEPQLLSDFHGEVHFYDSNWAGLGHGCYCTHGDEPYEGWHYRARFSDGKLVEIVNIPDDPPSGQWLPSKEYHERCDRERAESWKKEFRENHSKAMQLAELADRTEKPKERADLLYEAAEIESRLARRCHQNPTQAVLYRSAAQLWLEAGHPWESLKGIAEWMQFNQRDARQSCPAEIKAEIGDILRKIADLL